MPSVLAILADGFEEIEAITPIDLLRRADVEVILAHLGDGIHVTGKCGLTMHTDTSLAELPERDFDCLLLPGGPGVEKLRKSDMVLNLVHQYYTADRLVAAICAAPTVLHDAGVLTGHRYTAHFSVADELTEILSNEKIVFDRNILTSRGAGTAMDFGLALIESLSGRQKAQEIAQAICL